VLLPIALHEEGVRACLAARVGTSTYKSPSRVTSPVLHDGGDAHREGRMLRVMENYLFYEPLVKLKESSTRASSERSAAITSRWWPPVAAGGRFLGTPTSGSSKAARQGRGVLLFDDGWHKLSTALWLFGPVKEVRAWVGSTEVVPGIEVDAPTTVIWEHESGVRGVWDITLAVDMYLRSDYYTNDERWEVTGRRGYARVNRCTVGDYSSRASRCISTARCTRTTRWTTTGRVAFATRVDTGSRWLRTGVGPLYWSGEEALDVLRVALAAYESSAMGGVGVAPRELQE
jgi:predicted dehydrogenase